MEQTFDLVDKLMAYENNELSDMECVELFSYLDRNNPLIKKNDITYIKF